MTTNHSPLQHSQTFSWTPLQDCRFGGEREHLFEKPLTPSDVGKLNRLVIPKHHAEKYFPLDGESGEKGLILCFEDERGKAWSFRYSYWTSSQSYVLTKGWSRYVKEKRLDAGDVVLFERQRSDADRLYIGWKRRGEAAPSTPTAAVAHSHGSLQWSPLAHAAQPTCSPQGCASPQETAVAPAPPVPMAVSASSKRLRLFGVNMEYGLLPDPASSSHEQQLASQRELQLLPCGSDLDSHL